MVNCISLCSVSNHILFNLLSSLKKEKCMQWSRNFLLEAFLYNAYILCFFVSAKDYTPLSLIPRYSGTYWCSQKLYLALYAKTGVFQREWFFLRRWSNWFQSLSGALGSIFSQSHYGGPSIKMTAKNLSPLLYPIEVTFNEVAWSSLYLITF